ncbi:MAG: ribonuclease HII [Actinobacteria bacterium]|nr:MAG: ribonuclease HII [Actinomycetota bacterium]
MSFGAISARCCGDPRRIRRYPRPVPLSTGQRLLRFDRRLGARFVAGADEAGRGPLAGPLVVAGVLLDYATLRGHRVRPLAELNDSKQVSPADREELFHAVVGCARAISVRVVPAQEIDRFGLHRSNLAGLRAVLTDLHPPADACLVDGFRLGPSAPPHRAVVDGDTKSAAIAAASIVAKVVRDRLMRRVDAVYPRYGFSSHVGYITPGHTLAVQVHGPCDQHRRSFNAKAYADALVDEVDEHSELLAAG